jgi:hypothetical protein
MGYTKNPKPPTQHGIQSSSFTDACGGQGGEHVAPAVDTGVGEKGRAKLEPSRIEAGFSYGDGPGTGKLHTD